MKKQFFDYMLEIMKTYPQVYLIFVGLGWPRIDEFVHTFPKRSINTEASEQTALDIAVGLSYSGKIPVVYTITPFYWRAAETIRTYLDHENLPCLLVGAGVGEEYGEMDGFSHSGSDIKGLFNLFKNFNQYYPNTKEEMESAILETINNKKPSFINIHK